MKVHSQTQEDHTSRLELTSGMSCPGDECGNRKNVGNLFLNGESLKEGTECYSPFETSVLPGAYLVADMRLLN